MVYFIIIIYFFMGVGYQLPEQANFEEIGPENDLANFLSVHLTNSYSGNMAEPQQARRHSPQGRQESQDFLYLPWADRCEPYRSK